MEWRSFDLHPEFPPEGISRAERAARFGDDYTERTRQRIEGAGFVFDPPPDRVPRSGRALRLTELARDLGVLDRLHPRLMLGYWSRRRDIGDPEVLVEEAVAAGIDEPAARLALDSPELASRVAASTREALELGVTGVPGWVVDRRLLVPGAQPHEVFDMVMRRLGHLSVDEVDEAPEHRRQ